ncbi:hypothetical protein PAXRUDRAFT_347209 [Paxillus rubicundulus Ve08.2h10]|uniref:Uncharacterized protein n=1 Tax=Paxillus rubicundulus Ve08.2h10 TaxID=930991 RepID=A0A0D0DRY0_9AGAM|nr:hypothetical protein PAXRUDRAFT_347209 [Paxillus rubicundulus Ve08.2h10]
MEGSRSLERLARQDTEQDEVCMLADGRVGGRSRSWGCKPVEVSDCIRQREWEVSNTLPRVSSSDICRLSPRHCWGLPPPTSTLRTTSPKVTEDSSTPWADLLPNKRATHFSSVLSIMSACCRLSRRLRLSEEPLHHFSRKSIHVPSRCAGNTHNVIDT